MKLAITLLILGVLVVAGAWYFVVVMDTPTVPGAGSMPTTTVDGVLDDESADQTTWQSFVSETQADFRFSLSYPPEAEISEVQENIYELKYIGPDAEPNTEITDGYYVSLVFDGDTTLGTYNGREDAAGEVRNTEFSGYTGVTYNTISELTGAEVQHWVIAPDSEAAPVLDVAAQVYGNGQYQMTVDRILESISFEEAGGDEATNTAIRILEPQAGETIGSPIELSGEVRGTWLFEATAPVVVVDWDGRIIGESFIEAEGDWMTENFVPFSGTVEYTQEPDPVSASGTVIFQKANPSGLPENDSAVEIPVSLE